MEDLLTVDVILKTAIFCIDTRFPCNIPPLSMCIWVSGQRTRVMLAHSSFLLIQVAVLCFSLGKMFLPHAMLFCTMLIIGTLRNMGTWPKASKLLDIRFHLAIAKQKRWTTGQLSISHCCQDPRGSCFLSFPCQVVWPFIWFCELFVSFPWILFFCLYAQEWVPVVCSHVS